MPRQRHPELDRVAHRLDQAASEHDRIVAELRSEANAYLVSSRTDGARSSNQIADPVFAAMMARDDRLRVINDLERAIKTISGAVAAYERLLRQANLAGSPARPVPTCSVDGCELLVEHQQRVDGTITYRRSGLCSGHRTAARRAGK